MAVRIKFLSVVVPVENINKSPTSGGFTGFLKGLSGTNGKSFWYDEQLFVAYAMNPMDIQALVEQFEALGLVSRIEVNGQRSWKDLCVVDFYQGPTLSCDWLEYDLTNKTAWMKGSTSTTIAGPDLDGDPAPLFVPNHKASEFFEFAVESKASNSGSRPWWKLW